MTPNETQIEFLLDDLCGNYGFCLSSVMQSRLTKFPPKTSEKFTKAVIEAEGLNALTMEKELYNQVLSRVQETFKINDSSGN